MGCWMVCRSLCFLAGLSLLSAQPLLPGDDVCVTEADWRFECGHPGISSSDCTSQGCCFDPRSSAVHPCFYSLRNSPVCTADGQFLLVISKNLTRPALNLSSLYVKDGQEAECRPKLTTAQLVTFRFPITSCGSTKREENGTLVYETDVLGKRMIQTGKLGSITRDSTFSLHVQCKYKGRQETGLQINVTVYTAPPPPPASEDGILELELRIAKGGNYRSWYVGSDYPIQSFLQDPVFVEVHVKDRTDPMIVLKLRDCWATPVPDLNHEVQWSLLVDGCPYVGDDYQTVLHTVDVFSGLKFPTHHKRFEVKTFVFLQEDSEQPLWKASNNTTFHRLQERRRSTNDHKGTLVSAPGPIIFLEDESALSQKLHEVNDAAGSHWALRGAAIGFMMVSLSLLVVMATMYRMKGPRAVASKCSEIELKADYYLMIRLGMGEVQGDLGVLVNHSLTASIQVQQAVRKKNCMLAFIAIGFEYRSKDVFLQSKSMKSLPLGFSAN
ncbi:zona pellucida sperm-binding protein 4-like [Heterodontus francisci]|uniref:zona pellucida sperm-binding protein 4-like n=1 Tax=Heterodontus francisci TaxID=7792 RepID=UPI00355C8B50